MKRLAASVLITVLALGCKRKPEPPPAPVPSAETTTAPTGPTTGSAAPDAAFWSWFTAHAAELRADADIEHTMETISAELGKARPGVFAEIGGDGADRTLVLSVDGNKELFPVVQQLYAARPTVPGWTIVAFRQRDTSPGTVIEMAGVKLDPSTMRFVGRPGDGKLDVTVFVPGFTTTDEMGQPLFILLDHVVGEFDMETKIGGIDFAPIARAPDDARPLLELPARLDRDVPIKP